MSADQGISLIELANTVAIAGLLVVCSLPAFGRYHQSLSARNTFDQLLLDLRLARQAALSEHSNVLVIFEDGPPARYQIVVDTDGDLTPDVGEREFLARALPDRMTLDATRLTPADTLAFLPSGRLPDFWTGGEVQLFQDENDVQPRALRAWPTGAVEALARPTMTLNPPEDLPPQELPPDLPPGYPGG